MNLLSSNVLSYLRGVATATTLVLTTIASNPNEAVAQPDLYVMAMSYQPEFCFLHKNQDFAGCQHPMDYWKTHLTIHGLWPEYKDGTWPSTCTREPLDEHIMDEFHEALEMYWPNVKEPEKDPQHDEFWRHEWSKHGTCSGLSQEAYFQSALQHSLPTPEMIQHSKTVKKEAVLQAYGGADKVVTVCSNKKYLSEVRTCLSVGKDGLPQGKISCPTKVLEEDSCGETIILAKFPNQREGNLRGSIDLLE